MVGNQKGLSDFLDSPCSLGMLLLYRFELALYLATLKPDEYSTASQQHNDKYDPQPGDAARA
jgi:hypothetical protein